VENFGLRIFEMADREDRSGKATRGTAKKFLAAANFLELLRVFDAAGVSESVSACRTLCRCSGFAQFSDLFRLTIKFDTQNGKRLILARHYEREGNLPQDLRINQILNRTISLIFLLSDIRRLHYRIPLRTMVYLWRLQTTITSM
jgi:Vta1 like